jgi:hypothetical protein
MKPDPYERFIKEILEDEDLAWFRQASLESGLKALQRRRTRRKIFGGSVMAAFALLAIVLVVWPRSSELDHTASLVLPEKSQGPETAAANHPLESSGHQMEKPPTSANQASVDSSITPAEPAVRIINEEELFALFPGRSLALIGKPGGGQIFLLGDE